MDKVEALGCINEAWNSKNLSLEEKIIRISSDFYAVGLDISTTVAYIKATTSELDALLSYNKSFRLP